MNTTGPFAVTLPTWHLVTAPSARHADINQQTENSFIHTKLEKSLFISHWLDYELGMLLLLKTIRHWRCLFCLTFHVGHDSQCSVPAGGAHHASAWDGHTQTHNIKPLSRFFKTSSDGSFLLSTTSRARLYSCSTPLNPNKLFQLQFQSLKPTWVTAAAAQIQAFNWGTVAGEGGQRSGQVKLVQGHRSMEDILERGERQNCFCQ